MYAATDVSVSPDGQNYRRMQQENLVSVVVVGSGHPEADRTEIAAIADWMGGRFSYYEIIALGAAPPRGWRKAMQALGSQLPNLRVISLQTRLGYEDAQIAALDHAIGDYLVLVYPGEISIPDLERLTADLAEGRSDIIKTFHRDRGQSRAERVLATLTGWVLRLSTGQRIEAFQARAVGMSRAAVTRMQSIGGVLRFFRILDVSDQIATARIEIDAPPRRRFWSAFSDKLRLMADLVSLSAARLIRSLAFACFAMAAVSFITTVVALLIWLFKADIAPGWTSLSVLFSVLFGANFAVLGAICLGLLQLIRRAEPDTNGLFASELSGGDFFDADGPLNVQADKEEQHR